ncbi:putative amid-like mitochondrial oxidoreductase protein [Botrytis fragariae]|uniref:Putative amid-like mitochondrial oxidoreductase protein n=1 Tax=Botrytis fragariae TaxID=1964551 RepID=A0A8H6AJY6_9HELO|nr:putative amid-like mitochondrial oxidoreductase protein [Botrytis fragariae]KAF5868648.1 putative amid-like mitochondrial oxidoreductase protein [Botrytis fragariae]
MANLLKNILILGGSYAGVSTAHRILKQSAKAGLAIKITLVSPNTHVYWNLAATRAIVPGGMPDEKVFASIATGFKQYTADKFEFIVGTAEGLDVENKTVVVSRDSERSSLNYDILILATGSRPKEESPFKGKGSYQESLDLLHEWQAKVKDASSIYVAGAGATGVETAGELGFAYGSSKQVTLIASGPVILEGTPASVSKTATKQLENLQVKIKVSTKVSGTAKTPDGKTEITLSNGEKIITDLYIPTMGLIPNSSFIPEKYLNPAGFAMVDQFLRLKDAENVWVVGDVSAVERPQYVNTDKQSTHVAKNIVLILKNSEPLSYKVADKNMLAVPVGKKVGTGHMGGMKFPSFVVNMVKGKTLFTEKLAPMVNGSAF